MRFVTHADERLLIGRHPADKFTLCFLIIILCAPKFKIIAFAFRSFGNPDDRHLYISTLQNLSYAIDLGFTAINQKHKRQRPFGMIEASFDHFGKTIHITLSLDASNFKFAILIFIRSSMFEYHHAPDFSGNTKVRNIIPLDTIRIVRRRVLYGSLS